MACKCVEEVNTKLAEKNTRLRQAMVLTGDSASNNPYLMLETDQIELGRGKPKAVTMFPSCCPFCGERYVASDATATTDEDDDAAMNKALAWRVGQLSLALRHVKEAIENAPQDIITDTFWMPETVLMGATVVDFIGLALEEKGPAIPDMLPFDHVILEQADNVEGGTVTQTVRRPDGTEYQRIVDYDEAYAGIFE